MSAVQTSKMTNWRWVMCAMLFFATTVNYMDRQVLSLTFKEFIQPEFHWTDSDYGTITGVFSICYAIFFGIHWFFYRRYPQKVGSGFFFGLCLFLIFTSRIFIEYTKENQEAFEEGMLLNMGQLLSIPFVVLGLYCMYRGIRKDESTDITR